MTENQVLFISNQSISLQLKQGCLNEKLSELLSYLKNKIKIKINNKFKDDETVIMKIKGEQLLNLFNFEEILNGNENRQFEQLKFKESDDHQIFQISSLSLYLADSFLKSDFLIKLAQKISVYERIGQLDIRNKEKNSINDESILSFLKELQSVQSIDINLNQKKESEIPSLFLKHISNLSLIKNLEQLVLEGFRFQFERNFHNSVECIKFDLSSKDIYILQDLNLQQIKKLNINLKSLYSNFSVNKAINYINNLSDLQELCLFNKNNDKKYASELSILNIGSTNLKVLDTFLTYDNVYKTIQQSPNLQILKLNSLINNEQDFSVLNQLNSLQLLSLKFEFLDYKIDETLISIQQFQRINSLDLSFKLSNLHQVRQVMQNLEGFQDKVVQFRLTSKDKFFLEYKQQQRQNNSDQLFIEQSDFYEIDLSFNLRFLEFLGKSIYNMVNPSDSNYQKEPTIGQSIDSKENRLFPKRFNLKVKQRMCKIFLLIANLQRVFQIFKQSQELNDEKEIFVSKKLNYINLEYNNFLQENEEPKIKFELKVYGDAEIKTRCAQILIDLIPFDLNNHQFKLLLQFNCLESANQILKIFSKSQNTKSYQKITFSQNFIQIEWIQDNLKNDYEQEAKNELDVNVQNDKLIQKDGLEKTLNMLSSMNYLTNLGVYFDWQNIQTKQNLHQIMNISSNQMHLKHFGYFYFGKFINPNIFSCLLDEQIYFQNLISLSLCIGRENIADDSARFQLLGKAISRCEQLKVLDLAIGGNNTLEYEDLRFIIDKAVALKQLYIFNFRHYESNMTCEQVIEVLSTVSENKQIIKLSFQLDIIRNRLEKQNLNKLWIKKFSHLKYLHINIQNWKLQEIQNQFKRLMKRLTILDLNSQICKYAQYQKQKI